MTAEKVTTTQGKWICCHRLISWHKAIVLKLVHVGVVYVSCFA